MDRIFSLEQAHAAGCTTKDVTRQVRAGRLRRLHREVYGPGGELSMHDRGLAAVLAIGHDAVVSREHAARLHHADGLGNDPRDHVSVSRRKHFAPRPGLFIHRAAWAEGDVIEVDGLPVTSPVRTAVDLLANARRLNSIAATESMLRAGTLQPADLAAIAARVRRWPAATKVRMRLELVDARSRSLLETGCRLRLLDAGFTELAANHLVLDDDGVPVAELDLALVRQKVAIELDGVSFHSDPEALYADRIRQNRLVAMGWTILRFTWRDVFFRPAYVVATVRAAIAAAA